MSRQSFTRTEKPDGRTEDVKSLEVGVQISCCIHPEIQKEKFVQGIEAEIRSGISRVGETQGLRNRGGSWMVDHVHMMISIPPKYSVSQVIGYIKGKSAIHIARTYQDRKRNFVGQHFWARGYYVSTVGRDEDVVREYIRNQENEDIRVDQLDLLK